VALVVVPLVVLATDSRMVLTVRLIKVLAVVVATTIVRAEAVVALRKTGAMRPLAWGAMAAMVSLRL